MSEVRVAVVGATGAVGQEMLRVLESRQFPAGEVVALASERSRGREVTYRGEKLAVRVLDPEEEQARIHLVRPGIHPEVGRPLQGELEGAAR